MITDQILITAIVFFAIALGIARMAIKKTLDKIVWMVVVVALLFAAQAIVAR